MRSTAGILNMALEMVVISVSDKIDDMKHLFFLNLIKVLELEKYK